MIVIIDYGMGNIASIKKAFCKIRISSRSIKVSRDHSIIKKAKYLVLPGVGAFADGMDNLRSFGLLDILSDLVLEKRVPFLGICLGR